MLSDVEKGNNQMLTRLTPVATLTDTKQQSATTCFTMQIITFSWHLCNRRDARVESHTHAKRTILGKSYQRNQIYLHWTKPKILLGYSVAIAKTGIQSICGAGVGNLRPVGRSSDAMIHCASSLCAWNRPAESFYQYSRAFHRPTCAGNIPLSSWRSRHN